jgi:hypothetical protein
MAKETGPVIRDFDAVAPAGRKAKIGGRVVDVSFIPGRVTLEMARFKDRMDAGELSEMARVQEIIDLVAKVTERQDAEMTADWLLDNVDFVTLFEFVQFVLTPTMTKAKEYEEKQGNGGAASS